MNEMQPRNPEDRGEGSRKASPPVTSLQFASLRSDIATIVVLCAAAGFTLLLLTFTRNGVFYSGDAGLKFLMTAQFAEGDLHPDLHLHAPAWVETLWDDGYFPFQEPAVSVLDGRRFILYPLFFPALSAPAFRMVGFTGLFIIPTLGAWLTLWVLSGSSKSLGMSGAWRAAVVATVAFSSPFLLYGAMFWEHTLGVGLALLGFWLAEQATTNAGAMGAGASLGVAAWLRPELAILAVIAVSLAWVDGERRRRACRWSLAASVMATLAAFGSWNLAVYGVAAGLHGGSGVSPAARLQGSAVVAMRLGTLLLEHFPLVIPFGAAAVLTFIDRSRPEESGARRWLAAGIIFCALVPLILHGPEREGHGGKQWGPRFLLVAICLLTVGAIRVLQSRWPTFGRLTRLGVGAALLLLAVRGAAANIVHGTIDVRDDYSGRVLPALNRIRAADPPVVVVANQAIAMELATAMATQPFVLARDGADLDAIGFAAADAGLHRIVFIGNSDLRVNVVRILRSRIGLAYARVSFREVVGDYAFHEIELVGADER